MKQLVLALMITPIFMSCSKEEPIGGVNLIATANIGVEDASGNNLLDPATPGHYKAEDIKVFFLVEGQRKEFINESADNPKTYAVAKLEPKGEYYLRVTTNHMESSSSLRSTAYIQWNNKNEDTLVSFYVKDKGNFYINEAHWNGKTKFQATNHNAEQNWGTKAFSVFLMADK